MRRLTSAVVGNQYSPGTSLRLTDVYNFNSGYRGKAGAYTNGKSPLRYAIFCAHHIETSYGPVRVWTFYREGDRLLRNSVGKSAKISDRLDMDAVFRLNKSYRN